MRIAQFTPTYFDQDSVIGGGERYPLYVEKSLATVVKSDLDSILLGFGSHPQKTSRITVIEGDPNKKTSCNWADFRRRIRDADCLIIHQCLSEIGLTAAAHGRLARVKSIIGFDHGGGSFHKLNNHKSLCTVYDTLICQSIFTQDQLIVFGVPSALITGPVDDIYFAPYSHRRSFSAKDYKLKLLSVGRILPHKGFEDTILAAPEESTYTICGSKYDNDYLAFLENLAIKKKIKLNVLEGLSDRDVRHLMRTSDLYIHPSKHEDYKGHYHEKPELLGLAPLEALCSGTRTITSSAGALRELAQLKGCWSFTDIDHLSSLIHDISLRDYSDKEAREISLSASKRYGLMAFGSRLSSTIQTLIAP
jgi:glycosyltransferase involved in cell wall biosynthesis